MTTKALRRDSKIRKGERVKANVTKSKPVTKPLPRIEEILKKQVLKISAQEAEKLSEDTQKEIGIYG